MAITWLQKEEEAAYIRKTNKKPLQYTILPS